MRQTIDALVDEASEESFPASDPPSYWARNPSEIQAEMTTVASEEVPKEGKGMAEEDVMGTIEELAHEEHELREREGAGGISNDEKARLQALEVKLDQCWDLLRQRRARRAAGLDPDEAQVRDADTVENYLS